VDLIVNPNHLGTPESKWQSSGRLDVLTPLDIDRPRRVVVVAPHPDDEVLGAGGLIRHLIVDEIPFDVLAITDGEASHPVGTGNQRRELRRVRPQETLRALHRLGCRDPKVTRLGIPDGCVRQNKNRLLEELAHVAHEDDLWLAPWRYDGHPDHDTCGEAVDTVAAVFGMRSLSYFIWAWHWADPSGVDLPWRQCRRFDLDCSSLERKRWSIEAFESQIQPLGSERADGPVLPPSVLERFQRSYEVYVDEGSAS